MGGGRYALIIANGKFEDKDIKDLNAPITDAMELYKLLSDSELGGFECEIVFDEKSSTLLEKIEDFFEKHDCKNDTVLIYYGGHGIRTFKDNKLYLAARNTTETKIRSTAISDYFISETIRTNNSGCQIIILDCCYSGSARFDCICSIAKGKII